MCFMGCLLRTTSTATTGLRLNSYAVWCFIPLIYKAISTCVYYGGGDAGDRRRWPAAGWWDEEKAKARARGK